MALASLARRLGHPRPPLLRPLHSHTHPPPSPPTSSVSQHEIDHFTSLAAGWWDERPDAEFAVLQRMNRPRVQFLRERIVWAREAQAQAQAQAQAASEPPESRFLHGLDVLDVGCGGGLFSENLARLGARTLGIDAAKVNIDVARAHAALDPTLADGLVYEHKTAEDLLQEPGSRGRFDVVCSMDVLEHVEDPRGFIFSLADLVKPGGHLILSTISRTLLSHLLTITIAEARLPFPFHNLRPSFPSLGIGRITPGTHTYSKFIKPSELRDFVGRDLGWVDGVTSEREAWQQGGRREAMETRGVIWEPWKGEWTLLDRRWSDGSAAGEWCNYLLGARKPVRS